MAFIPRSRAAVYFSRIARPVSRPPSPSMNISRASSLGASVRRFFSTPQWFPPFSNLPRHSPETTLCGSRSVQYAPMKSSRRQSKPSGSKSAAKNWKPFSS